MVPPVILPIITKALNQYLQCDPEMQQKLKAFDNRVMRITVTTLDWTFYLKVQKEKISLIAETSEPIDAAIKASLMALTKASCSQQASISDEIELSGDTGMVHAITKIFQSVEIDWEEMLSNYTGDAIAHKVGSVIRGIQDFHNRFWYGNQKNIQEYIQEEINLLVHPNAVDGFYKNVDEFRDAVERLQAKVALLEKGIEKSHEKN